MRTFILILCLLISGCSQGVFTVPQEDYQRQIKTLGVLPLLVDGQSAVHHPAGEEVFDLVRRASVGLSGKIVEDLRGKKGYFDVRLINEAPRLLVEKLLVKPSTDELGQPAGYQLNLPYLAELCKDSFVDGLLLLNLQGAVHNDKRWSRNTFETLITDYNDIMATASVVAADGKVLWEMNGADATTILALQYPDFDEAYFNKTDVVQLKYIGLSGLERTLLPTAEKGQESPEPGQLSVWLEKVTAALSPKLFR